MLSDLLQNPEVQRLLLLTEDGLLFAIWETIYVTVLSTLFAYIIGLPLGVLVVVGEKNGILPLPKPLMNVLNVIINLLRSVPFLILMVLVIPLSRVEMCIRDRDNRDRTYSTRIVPTPFCAAGGTAS